MAREAPLSVLEAILPLLAADLVRFGLRDDPLFSKLVRRINRPRLLWERERWIINGGSVPPGELREARGIYK